MEGKRKNRKNKNKAPKEANNGVPGAGKNSSPQGKTEPDLEQNHQVVDSNNVVSVTEGKSESVPKQNHQVVDANNVAPKSSEASVTKEKCESILKQNHQAECRDDVGSQSIAMENLISELGNHNFAESQAILEKKVENISEENSSFFQQKAILEEKVENILRENGSLLHQKAILEKELEDIKTEIYSWSQEKVDLKERVKLLEDERKSWMSTETSAKETIDKLDSNKVLLQKQVTDLEVSRDNLVQENQSLTKIVSDLESRVLKLEASLASCKIESVIESHKGRELDGVSKEGNQMLESNTTEAEIIGISEYASPESDSDQKAASPRNTHVNTPVNVSDPTLQMKDMLMSFDKNPRSLEISQLPSHEIQIEEQEQEVVDSEEQPSVSFSDAPLIGAPFRLISFVSRYVVGADLVNEKRSTSGR